MTDEIIIKAFKSDINSPNKDNITAYSVVRSQINPCGLQMKFYSGLPDKEMHVNYISFVHPEEGVFCLMAIETLFSLN
jgi:hypothetical protein